MFATANTLNLHRCHLSTATSQDLRRQAGSKTHQADWQPGSTNPPTSQTSRYHSNYLDPLRSREEESQRSSHYLSAIYRSERERWGKGHRHKDGHLWSPFTKPIFSPLSQSLWAISSCSNPPLLLLLRLSGRADIRPLDLSASLSADKLTDQPLCSMPGKANGKAPENQRWLGKKLKICCIQMYF